MNSKSQLIFAALLLSGACVAHAGDASTETPTTEAAQTAPQTQEAQDTKAPAGKQKIQLPKLIIKWQCKNCTENEKVAPLIESSYIGSAAKNGYSVSATETAETEITDFRQRPPGVRVAFGVFAGKDRLAVRTTYHGKEFIAQDYSANSFFGMDSLCESVAKKLYVKILDAIKAEQKTTASN
jgi:hypothetical protein